MRASGQAEIERIAETVERGRLYCIELAVESLAEVELKKEWMGLPLVYRMKGSGRILDCMPVLDNLRKSAARFYFSATPENITAVRALSSLMVKTGLFLDETCSEWEALEDLLAYDAFGKVEHVPVEPFRFVYSGYKEKALDYNELYLDSEGAFIHCDEQGNLAVSRAMLAKGEFAGTLSEPPDFGALRLAAREKGRAAFLKFEGCSVCPAWHVCGVRKSGDGKKCSRRDFMSALMDTAREVNENAINNI